MEKSHQTPNALHRNDNIFVGNPVDSEVQQSLNNYFSSKYKSAAMPFTTPLGYFEQGMTLLDYYFGQLLANPNVYQHKDTIPLEIRLRDLLDVAKVAIQVAHREKANEIANNMMELKRKENDVHMKDIESDVKTKEDEL